MLTARPSKATGEIPTCSMADIAFLLLIFFLVTTTIDMDKGIGLTLPAKGETIEVASRNIINILVNAAGDVMIGDEIVGRMQIKERVRMELQKNPRLILSVKTDRETRYDDFIAVMDQIKMAGATRISLAEPEI